MQVKWEERAQSPPERVLDRHLGRTTSSFGGMLDVGSQLLLGPCVKPEMQRVSFMSYSLREAVSTRASLGQWRESRSGQTGPGLDNKS